MNTRVVQKEYLREEREQGQKVVRVIESVFTQRVNHLKERISNEQYERKVAEQAQMHALTEIHKEIKADKRKEVERFEELSRIDKAKNYIK